MASCQVKSELRQILLLMGFQEMKTNQFVESSFWNFDTLFQPQQHPVPIGASHGGLQCTS